MGDKLKHGSKAHFVEHKISALFEQIGRWIARHPFVVLVSCVVLAGILLGGLPMIKSVSNAEELYTPSRNNRAAEDKIKWEEATWKIEAQRAQASGSEQGEGLIEGLGRVLAYQQGANVLSTEALTSIFALHKRIINDVTITIDGVSGLKFADLCVRTAIPGSNACKATGLMDLVDESLADPFAALRNLDTEVVTFPGREPQATVILAGGRTDSADGSRVDQAMALAMNYEVSSFEWEDAFLVLMLEESKKNDGKGPGGDLYKVAFQKEGSPDEELEKSTNGDTVLLVTAFTLVMSFTVLVMGSFSDFVSSKRNLSLPAVSAVGLCIGSAFGLMGYCGVTFNPVVATTAFLLLGLGVDDAYVMIQSWHYSAYELPGGHTVEDRVGHTMGKAGVSVFFTSLTDMLAFGVGATSLFPSIVQFCAYTSTGIFFAFLYQVFFLAAAMALDGHREYCGVNEFWGLLGKGWLWGPQGFYRSDRTADGSRLTDDPSSPDGKRVKLMPDAEAVTKFAYRYGQWLITPIPSAIVCIIWCIYLGISIWGATNVGTGLDTRDLAPSDSYWSTYVDENFRYFQEKGPLLGIGFPQGSVVYGTESGRNEIKGLMDKLESLACLEAAPFSRWIDDHDKWVQAGGGGGPASLTNEKTYAESVIAWLETPGGLSYANKILFDGTFEGGSINVEKVTESRMFVRMERLTTTSGDTEGVPCVKNIREVLDTYQLSGAQETRPYVAGIQVLVFWEASAVIVSQTVSNLIYAAACCFFVTMVILPHPVLCCVTMGVVAMILVGVVGSMELILDMRIETISMIDLILAIGFSIDNVAHYCHAFMSSHKFSRRDRALDALQRIWAPILYGDVSTMIALLTLLASQSKIFRSFFKILFTVLLLGGLHSTVLLPVLLGWLGPCSKQSEGGSGVERELEEGQNRNATSIDGGDRVTEQHLYDAPQAISEVSAQGLIDLAADGEAKQSSLVFASPPTFSNAAVETTAPAVKDDDIRIVGHVSSTLEEKQDSSRLVAISPPPVVDLPVVSVSSDDDSKPKVVEM